MRDYKIQQYGKPRFHICKCNVIEEFIETGGFRQHYVRANSDPVPVRNRDNGYEEVMVKDLPICRACLEKLRENCQDELAEDFDGINSSLFVKMLKEANGEEEIKEAQEVDIFGYTRDWDRISKAYREKKNYTCEKCGLQIDNLYDRQYIHCHHKDFNKLNNKESNLQCLCMRCHANIDDNHRKNLTTGANGIIFNTFNAKYPNKPIGEEPESRKQVPF